MDVLSHGLWGVAFTRRRVRWWLAALSGAIPDVIAFLPARVVELAEGRLNYRHEVRPYDAYPAITRGLYDATHSAVGVAAVALLAYGLLRLAPGLSKRTCPLSDDPLPGPGALACWITAPWALHVMMDVPVHTADFFPTPVLWPFSELVFDGVPWAQPLVFLPNVALLLFALWWTWPRASTRPGLECAPDEA
jgi:hypothetical protein